MNILATVALEGISGKKYEFEVYCWDTEFPSNMGAVYVITHRHISRAKCYSHKEIYVGQTEDLSTRFYNHHKKECFKSNSANCKCIYKENSESKRLEIEKDLIRNYQPICND